ncbi:dTDP-4-amino-4,6-dideoxygalactose transaminase [Segatella bryantii]|uniref:dTDP-4-amino-4,6-dideoxygalactose transaminase n=1 Tax=Segatella bryantii TaxID=77095 RepID=A0ABX4EM84_SEGBR|nr:dTDP-4-amino-4,6-dideoxygalactose transaminase [Segatella bryantii]OYP57153.1 dTDP-4-amino-4,6-dideoxygalactose transaminase [Segatella bryantii]UKK82263.1 dTDP-4-amino-4,6-dideoxygalactose transaminase [Segatella bryantii]
MIPFNKPYCSGRELKYIEEVCHSTTMSGNGQFTKKCHTFFEEKYGFKKCLLATSGTDALEMCAMLCNLKPGDEVIVPSYTFVSTALAFLREGAKVVFADSSAENPNMEVEQIEPLINEKTKVIAVVHYAGVACDMDAIMALAEKHNLLVVEDAAHCIDSFYKGRPLGSIGHLGAFSFHETKNISSGEGGMCVINDERFVRRAEIIWEKGTNRAEFYRGMVNKYGWVDMGSSFLPSEFNAAYLWAQLEQLDDIQDKRKHIWNRYFEGLNGKIGNEVKLPNIPEYATNNAHMFYLLCPSLEYRTALMKFLKENDVQTTFHYLPLHSSKFYENKHDGRELPNCDRYADTLVRLPLFYELSDMEIDKIVKLIVEFCNK